MPNSNATHSRQTKRLRRWIAAGGLDEFSPEFSRIIRAANEAHARTLLTGELARLRWRFDRKIEIATGRYHRAMAAARREQERARDQLPPTQAPKGVNMTDNTREAVRSTTSTIEELSTAKGNCTDEIAMKENGGSADSVTRNNGAQTPEHPPGPQQQANKSSPFDDIEALRKSNKAAFEGEREGVTAVTLGRPKKELYVKFHSDDNYYLPAYAWSVSDDSRDMYFIMNNLWDLEDLQGGLRAKILAPWLAAKGYELFLANRSGKFGTLIVQRQRRRPSVMSAF